MLADSDRIFTNLYGFQPWGIAHAMKRGDWADTKALIQKQFAAASSMVDAVAKEKGLTKDTTDAIKRMVLGIGA